MLGREPGQHKIFLDAQAAEDAAVLVHQLHARARDGVALHARQSSTPSKFIEPSRGYHAHETFQGRALARAVAAEQRHYLVALDPQGDVKEDMAIPVIGIQT